MDRGLGLRRHPLTLSVPPSHDIYFSVSVSRYRLGSWDPCTLRVQTLRVSGQERLRGPPERSGTRRTSDCVKLY